jgi:CDP-diacylglycerol--glycerol-3-phosphate 3-phosphatidyltransferase
MDPLADKILISAAFISFVSIPNLYIPAWMVVLIISREFIITGLRLLARNAGKVVAASKEGKIKTTSQIVTILSILIILSLKSFYYDYGTLESRYLFTIQLIFYIIPYLLVLITTFLTLFSGINYIIKHKEVIWE